MARPLDRSGNLPKRSKWRNRPVLAGAVVFLLVVAIWRRNAPRVEESAKPALSQAALPSVALLEPKAVASFRSILIPDRRYVTQVIEPDHGISNQFMSLCALLLTGIMLDRVPILPEIVPLHVPADDSAPWSRFFDFDPLRRRSQLSILEWPDIKMPATSSRKPETLDCLAVSENDLRPRGDAKYGLKFKWQTDFKPRKMGPLTHVTHLTDLLVREEQQPQEQVACYSDLFAVRESVFKNGRLQVPDIGEITPGVVSLWDKIGQHLPFSSTVLQQKAATLAHVLPHAGADYLALHFRRGDFLQWHDVPPLSNFSQAIDDMASSLRGGHLPVLVASDTDEPALLSFVEKKGWILIDHDHLETEDKWGPWAPATVDMAILAGAKGFVGTWGSTMSFLAGARVETWNGGPVSFIKGNY